MDWSRIEAETEAAAREAGVLLLGYLGRLDGVEFKGEIDLVTEADRASEALLTRRLGEVLPRAALLAEEGSARTGDTGWTWIVDPLDGTVNFAHGYPFFGVSIALADAAGIALGMVFDPVRDELFLARRGKGATLNGAAIRVTGVPRLRDALLVTGFPYDAHTSPRNNVVQLGRFVASARGVRRDGSAALDLCYVACGRYDGFWEESLAPWDVAAGALIVAEAGGVVTGYRGEPFDPTAGHHAAANPALHARLVEVLTEIEDSGQLPPVSGRRRTAID